MFHDFGVQNVEIEDHVFQTIKNDAERLRLVLEGTRLGMWDWNPQTSEVIFDERWAEMLGYSLGEIKNELSEWSTRVHPDDLEVCLADIDRHIRGEVDYYENVHRMRHKDGSWRFILDRGRVMKRDDQGRVIRFTGTHTDVTREYEAVLQAQESKRSMEMFFTMMSHELRTPLTSILAAFELLSDHENDQKTVNDLLGLAENACHLLKQLVDNLLDFQKIKEVKFTLHPQPVSINELLNSVCLTVRGQMIKNNIRMEVENRLSTDLFLLDPDRLTQVLVNLLANAFKFTQALGTVRLEIEEAPAQVPGNLIFRVKDEGPGIPKEDQERIFSPFIQAHDVDSRLHGGSGLGLAICRMVCENMGGVIWLEPDVARGSCFCFTVEAPCAGRDAAHNPPLEEPDFPESFLNHKKILIAEDNESVRRILVIMLRKLGAGDGVVEADDGAKALDLMGQQSFDYLITDGLMPGISGDELTRRVKAMKYTGQVPSVIACTAHVSEEDINKFKAAGADSILHKPFGMRDLKRALLGSVRN